MIVSWVLVVPSPCEAALGLGLPRATALESPALAKTCPSVVVFGRYSQFSLQGFSCFMDQTVFQVLAAMAKPFLLASVTDRLSVHPRCGFHPTTHGCSVQLPQLSSASGALCALCSRFPFVSRSPHEQGKGSAAAFYVNVHAPRALAFDVRVLIEGVSPRKDTGVIYSTYTFQLGQGVSTQRSRNRRVPPPQAAVGFQIPTEPASTVC